jgi:hypothetical protein
MKQPATKTANSSNALARGGKAFALWAGLNGTTLVGLLIRRSSIYATMEAFTPANYTDCMNMCLTIYKGLFVNDECGTAPGQSCGDPAIGDCNTIDFPVEIDDCIATPATYRAIDHFTQSSTAAFLVINVTYAACLAVLIIQSCRQKTHHNNPNNTTQKPSIFDDANKSINYGAMEEAVTPDQSTQSDDLKKLNP